MSEPITVTLTTPITAYGAEVKTLTLRRPTGQDARELGALPYSVNDAGRPVPDLAVTAKYLMRLCDIPMSSVDQISLTDLNTLIWQVSGFFLSADSET